MNWVDFFIDVLKMLVIIVPLVVELVKYVKKATREKQWNELLRLIMNLMAEAETKFQDGASRKEWVLMMVKASSDTINYDINMDQVSELVDRLCDMSKVVNAPITIVE